MFEVDGQKVMIERANQCLTVDDLSKKSGVKRSTICKLEKGGKTRIITVGKIARALGRKVEDFQKEV